MFEAFFLCEIVLGLYVVKLCALFAKYSGGIRASFFLFLGFFGLLVELMFKHVFKHFTAFYALFSFVLFL